MNQIIIKTKAKELMMSEMPRVKEIDIEEMCKCFSIDEAVKIAYIPIILTRAAFQYATTVAELCALYKLPYKKETRIIKQAVKDYDREIIGTVRPKVMQTLEDKLDAFFDAAGDNMDSFWWVLKNELLKQYPELPEKKKTLLCNLYTCLCLLHYVRRFEVNCDTLIKERTHQPYCATSNRQTAEVINACVDIMEGYKLKQTDMMKRAMKIITMKVNEVVLLKEDEI